MAEAIKLLMESDMTITEIANSVGYNSSNSFCRAFKRKFQISPGQYRQINKKARLV